MGFSSLQKGGPHLFHLLIISTIILGLLSSASAQLVNTRTAFRVLTDQDHGGSCDAHRAVVDPLLQEVFDMTKAAVDALNSAKSNPNFLLASSAKVTRRRILKMLQQLFIPQMIISKTLLKVDDNSLEAIERIREKFDQILEFSKHTSQQNLNIRLACNDDFLKPVEKTIPTDPSGGGVPLMESMTFLGHNPRLDWIFWDEDWPRYQPGGGYFDQTRILPPKGPVPKEGKCASNPRLPGFVLRSHEIITLCPNSFGSFPQGDKPSQTPITLKQNLRNFQNVVTAGDYLDSYYSVSGVLLHELTHWVFGSDDIPALTEGGQPKQSGEASYLWENCRNLAKNQPTGAENNADNYRLFATAMFLSAWDWHTGKAERPA